MTSRTRKSTSIKADEKKNVTDDGPRTRRNSCASNTQPYSTLLESIYENKIETQSKKKEYKLTTKLNDTEILQELEEGKRWKVVDLVHDDNTIKIKLSTKTDEYDFLIGAKELKKNDNKLSETPKKTRRTMGQINYNEDELMNKQEKECKAIINAATPSRNKNNKLQTTKETAESISRKRAKHNAQQQESQQHDYDENETCLASQISSPPKRPKSKAEIEQTPKKNSDLANASCTPKSGAKRKILPESEDVPRRLTRRTGKNYEVQYKQCSSSDNDIKNQQQPIVLLDELNPKKRTNKHSSKNVPTSESGESEIENKMLNANLNGTRRNTRARSVMADSKDQTDSPSKHLQNLNINNDVGTPKSLHKLKGIKTRLPLTPSSVQKSNTEHQEVARSQSQRIAPKSIHVLRDVQNNSDDESADSDDNYETEEESESSDSGDASYDSGNDSANEFQDFNRRNRNQKTNKRIPSTPKAHKRVSQVSMNTPTKAISRMSIGTPTLDKHRRTTSISKPSTPLQKARAKLHVSVLPKSLPCREEQFNDIYSFLHARLSDGSGGCIYISGVPGTGKTATVSEVISCLKKSVTKNELSDFDYIDINGMKLSEPRQAYVQIWKQMTGETKTWEESHKLLQNKFNSSSKRKMTLLLVDELDLLCTKRQDVVYNLLDWPSKANAKLVVVTIANTMDLPERILMGKVTSRLGLTRLTFPPYNFKQLEEIVVSRLKGANAFEDESIQLVARKVAAVSGDARRALDICRRSAEIAEKNGRQLVSLIDVKQALDEMIASPKIQAIKHCSDMEKYFLQAVCTEVQRTGVEEVVFKNVYMHVETLCSMDGLKPPNESEALEMCARLGSYRLLLCDHSRMDIHQRLLLNVSTDDVYFATKKDIDE